MIIDKLSYIVVFITTSNMDEAKKIANLILKRKLVACCNIIDKLDSSFWWQGKIDTASECLIICKTVSLNFNKIRKIVNEVHSYEVPEVIAIDISMGSTDYLKWIRNNINIEK